MSQPFLGEIRIFGFGFAPRNWALCSGQILPISQNTALFSLLGTTYGGNGQTTFALPDLRGRTALSSSQGPGLANRDLGEKAGAQSHTLLSTEMPAHAHDLNASSGAGTVPKPSSSVALAAPPTRMYADATSLTALAASSVVSAGGSQVHNNMQPYLTLNFCIALQGNFPSRN